MIPFQSLRLLLASLLLVPVFHARVAEKTRIQIGLCGSMQDIERAKAAGFDYIELRTSEIAALSDADFESLIAKLKRVGIPVSATYLFIPANITLTGPTINKDEQMNYVGKALDRVTRLGAHVIAFGSGPARTYPAGFSKAAAFEQFVDFCKRIAPAARARNITIAIEPLRREESNLINSIAEGLDLVAAVNDPNIQLNLDYYHFEMEMENPAIILKAGGHIRHIHIANPNGRVFPLHAEEHAYAPFFANLRKIGYQGGMSLEVNTNGFEIKAPQSIRFLRAEIAGN